MYAVFQVGGKQYRATEGDKIQVERFRFRPRARRIERARIWIDPSHPGLAARQGSRQGAVPASDIKDIQTIDITQQS